MNLEVLLKKSTRRAGDEKQYESHWSGLNLDRRGAELQLLDQMSREPQPQSKGCG
jgi:hypothetical protein